MTELVNLTRFGCFLSCVCYAFVHVCLYVPCVTCWERADHLALVCGVYLLVCHFPVGILGQAGVVLDCIDS